MKIYKYKSYEEYEYSQKKANQKKAEKTWAVEENIKHISEILEQEKPVMGLCHGVRGGNEILFFRKYLKNCKIFGTEIGEVRNKYTTQWDFNTINPEWIKKFDFIYSNSYDHAFNPAETLQVWADQVKPGGYIILEYDKRSEHTGEISKPVNKVDPVSLTKDELIKFVPEWVKNANVEKVVDMPVVKKHYQYAVFIKIKKG